MKDIRWMIDVQKATGRTKSGRDIGEDILKILSEDPGESASQCWNCQIVLGSDRFNSGCPNCGCKDFGKFQAQDKISKED